MSERKINADLTVLVDQAIECLVEAGTGREYDPSWARPKLMSKEEIQGACNRAYHFIYAIKDALTAPRIVQLLISPNDACWQGVLLGLGSDGVTYHCKTGHWEPYIPELGYAPNKEIDG